MICLLHGWLLEGSGSNLWTRSIVTALARAGETVHLVCQENHPDRYEAIAEAYRHRLSGEIETKMQRDTRFPGKCILHQPEIGDTLPVFVKDKYEEYDRVVPMVDLPSDEIELYIERNVAVVRRIVEEHDIAAIHANHVVLMAVVAQRVSNETGIPFVVMPHGSGIEYAVKKDDRFRKYASSALDDADRIFVIGSEMRNRVIKVFPELPGIEAKFSELHLGVDASLFEPVSRAERQKNLDELKTSIASVKRGKTEDQSLSLHSATSPSLDRTQLKSMFEEHARYDGKSPDAGVEQKLAAIDWNRDPILLFTGRIISPKGIQSVVDFFFLFFVVVRDLHLVIVGHGPLREPLEAVINALRTGDRKLVENIAKWGRWLEGSVESDVPGDDLIEVTRFFNSLQKRGELDSYFESAQRLLRPESVVFTGYLTHRELQFLFPSCDAGIFPSVVREAGPLVFLEALASGCFPLGTYFGGMAASIDSVSAGLPEEVGATMKLGLTDTVEDIVRQVPRALNIGSRYKTALATIAHERYDWVSVAQTLRNELNCLKREA